MTLFTDWLALKERILRVVNDMDDYVGKIHTVHEAIEQAKPIERVDPLPPPPTVLVPTKPPPVVSTVTYRGEDIWATCFLNLEDEGRETESAYDQKFPPEFGKTVRGVALPWRVPPGTYVDLVWRKSTKASKVPVIDVGPLSTRDPYLIEGRRPRAEAYKGQMVRWNGNAWTPDGEGDRTIKCTGAGIDLTPPVWAELLGKSVEEIYRKSPSGEVDVVLYLPGSQTGTVELGERIAQEAEALLGKPFPYAPECEGGTLGCADVVSTALQRAGVMGHVLLVVEIQTALKSKGWTQVNAPYKRGDVVIWGPWARSKGHKHVGIMIDATRVMNNSSEQRRPDVDVLGADERPVEEVLRHG